MDRRTVMAAWVLFNDRDFIRQHHHQIDPEDIPRGALRWLVNEARRLWQEEKSLLTPDIMALLVDDTSYEQWGTTKDEVVALYLEIIESRLWNDNDVEALRNVARKWLRTIHAARSIDEAAEALETGDYDLAERTMARGRHASADFSPGMGWGPKHFPPQTRAVPTGIIKLDRWWLGGLHLGQVSFVLAPSNMGKSMLLPFFAANALKHKLNVLYYSTELTEADVFKRVLSALLEEPINDLLDIPQAEALAKAQLDRRLPRDDDEPTDQGFFEVRFRDPGSMATADLGGDLDSLEERGIRTHLIIIDGDDLTFGSSGRKYDRFYEAYKEVYTGLSSFAKTRQVAIWTAAQANKEGYTKKRLRAEHIADSQWKMRSSDMGLGMNMHEKILDEDNEPYMQLSVVKDRYYGTRGKGVRVVPAFGLKGSPGTVSFAQPDANHDTEDDYFKEAEKANRGA